MGEDAKKYGKRQNEQQGGGRGQGGNGDRRIDVEGNINNDEGKVGKGAAMVTERRESKGGGRCREGTMET